MVGTGWPWRGLRGVGCTGARPQGVGWGGGGGGVVGGGGGAGGGGGGGGGRGGGVGGGGVGGVLGGGGVGLAQGERGERWGWAPSTLSVLFQCCIFLYIFLFYFVILF